MVLAQAEAELMTEGVCLWGFVQAWMLKALEPVILECWRRDELLLHGRGAPGGPIGIFGKDKPLDHTPSPPRPPARTD